MRESNKDIHVHNLINFQYFPRETNQYTRLHAQFTFIRPTREAFRRIIRGVESRLRYGTSADLRQVACGRRGKSLRERGINITHSPSDSCSRISYSFSYSVFATGARKDTRTMAASIRANCRKVMCIGRNYAYVATRPCFINYLFLCPLFEV